MQFHSTSSSSGFFALLMSHRSSSHMLTRCFAWRDVAGAHSNAGNDGAVVIVLCVLSRAGMGRGSPFFHKRPQLSVDCTTQARLSSLRRCMDGDAAFRRLSPREVLLLRISFGESQRGCWVGDMTIRGSLLEDRCLNGVKSAECAIRHLVLRWPDSDESEGFAGAFHGNVLLASKEDQETLRRRSADPSPSSVCSCEEAEERFTTALSMLMLDTTAGEGFHAAIRGQTPYHASKGCGCHACHAAEKLPQAGVQGDRQQRVDCLVVDLCGAWALVSNVLQGYMHK